ncbi:hypothetical protein C2G38_2176564 [Gigaspora rosea]|uniref:Uncharacterized protein n=1 Tax=Gigaspora rosea TaxID=44941 RepID=A0A397VJA8_9GLOM|nr:hypothetical protein C2G38_2176564 [Gigaspora rosea]
MGLKYEASRWKPYKAELQDQGPGKIDQSKGLTTEEICQILLYLESNESLIFIIGREKNNQGGLKVRNKYGRFTSRQIHIPADQPNNEFKPIQDLQINNGNWFSKDRLEKNTLGNMMIEIARISDLNVNEHEMIQFSGYRSTVGLRTYKIPNNEQWLKNSTLLLNAIQESPNVQQEESQQEESQFMQQEESQVIQQEESQIMQQEKSQVMQQEEFQVVQQDESQATQFEKSQVMQHEVQITQHKEFQITHEFNSTSFTSNYSQKKTKAYTQRNSGKVEQVISNSIQKCSRPNPAY